MQHITLETLREMQTSGKPIQLIDVREAEEHAAYNIGGYLIPLGEITRRLDAIATDRPVVFYCRKGIRSQIAIQRLSVYFPDGDFYNLLNGIENQG